MFPDALPISEATKLIGYLRGTALPVPEAAYAAWAVAGYALGQTVGQPAPPVVGSVAPPDDDVALADCLESHVARRGDAVGAFPWALLAPILLKLVERFLSR